MKPDRIERPYEYQMHPDYIDVTTWEDAARGVRVGLLRPEARAEREKLRNSVVPKIGHKIRHKREA